MKSTAMIGLLCTALGSVQAEQPLLNCSDVVMMNEANHTTYANYGATVIAWGGKPTRDSLREAQGLKFFGSVGMVTEFAGYYERFPQTYEQGLCRDIDGNPVKVPWLTDHRHKDIPYWWCCTQQPLFRQYLSERVIETVQAGADGLHIDDHLGTAGGLWLGLCFCDRCVEGFRGYLRSLPVDQRQRLGVDDPNEFDYGEVLRQWRAADATVERPVTQHPLWFHWTVYQSRAAAAFMQELRELAARTAGHTIPVGANAGLLWPRHLADYKALDLFSAETDHRAEELRFTDLPLVAYRMADAVGRPYASTASGGDWAYVKQHQLPGLVRGWIALSYASGHALMAPHRQWCYTPQKGTHWYEGPQERFAPLYRFVRDHAALLDGYQAWADVVVVLPHRSFLQDPNRWFDLCNQLAAHNIAYELLLAGDEIVDHPLTATTLASPTPLLIPERGDFLPDDAAIVQQYLQQKQVFSNLEETLAQVRPAVRVHATGPVRVLPRIAAGSAVVHLLNYDYDPARDDVRPMSNVQVTLNLDALGVGQVQQCDWYSPDSEPVSLSLKDSQVKLPELGLWGILVLKSVVDRPNRPESLCPIRAGSKQKVQAQPETSS